MVRNNCSSSHNLNLPLDTYIISSWPTSIFPAVLLIPVYKPITSHQETDQEKNSLISVRNLIVLSDLRKGVPWRTGGHIYESDFWKWHIKRLNRPQVLIFVWKFMESPQDYNLIEN